MRVKGALHVHSRLSHDGTLTIPELADWFKQRGYNFFALGEHSQDMDAEKIAQMKAECAQNSNDKFLIIPGLEYSCRGGIHLFALGSTVEIPDVDPVTVATQARAAGAFVVLAHPSRSKWNCSSEIVKAVNAAEFWNVGYDGKFLPSYKALKAFRGMKRENPQIMATGGQDLHRTAAFYDLAVILEVPALSREAILAGMHSGNYQIRSRFFQSGPDARFSAVKASSLWLVSWQLAALRKARNLIQR
jgi:hypothetical protein